MSASPTGAVVRHGAGIDLVLTRMIAATQPELWAWISTSEKVAQWFGPFEVELATGRVEATMTAEECSPVTIMQILQCRAPAVLQITSADEPAMTLTLEISADDGGHDGVADQGKPTSSTLTFTHHDVDARMVGAMGSGWEFYLDRLVAAWSGQDPLAIDFTAYYPAYDGYFTEQLG